MTSRPRELGVRVALLCAFVATMFATHTAVAKPDLPFVLLESFDRAFSLAYDAAEREVEKREAQRRPSPRHDVRRLLEALERRIDAANDTASAALEAELALADALGTQHRVAVLACITRHLDEARAAVDRATDPDERAEYLATCERLRELRRMV